MRMRDVVGTVLLAVSVLLPTVSVNAAQSASQTTAQAGALCKKGNDVGYLGILWTCEKSGSSYVRVLSGPDLTQNSPKGGPGPCTVGDVVTVGGWPLTCRDVGGQPKWTQTTPPTGETFTVWGPSNELPGVCNAGSWFHMGGRKVECAAGSGSAAWKVGPILKELVSTNVSGELCAGGATTSTLGVTWNCTQLAPSGQQAVATWVASGPARTSAATRQGETGRCVRGDRLTIGTLTLTCASLGARDGWTHTWNGSNAGAIGTALHRKGQRIPGTCRKGSWIQLDGVRITCTGTRAGATTKAVKPPTSPKPSKPGAVTVSVPGMTKQACLNAWWDKEFAGVVSQLTARQDPALTERLWSACHRDYAKVMTTAERDAAYARFFGDLGTLVATEVQQVSARTGMNPCKAVETVLKPRYVDGWGLVGWDQSGFLPILYKEWQGGPVLGKIGGNSDRCSSGQISVQLRRHYDGRHEGPYYPALGTPDATWPISDADKSASWVKGATCLVWSTTFGNTAPGSAARVVGYNYTNMGDGVNMVAADNEVNKCEFKVAEAAGLPVVWKASASVNELRAVPPSYAGIWHTMADGCSWLLEPAGGGPRVAWNSSDGPYTTVELRAGDRFASTCQLQQNEWEHMIVAPDGLMPLQSLAPGARRPSTPGTCRYLVTDASALRSPQPVTALGGYAGSPVTFDVTTGADGLGKLLRSVGCGTWNLV